MADISKVISIHNALRITVSRNEGEKSKWITIDIDGISIDIFPDVDASDTIGIECWFKMAQNAFHGCNIEGDKERS